MNLVFVHGRNQAQRTECDIRRSWLEGLDQGFRGIGHRALDQTTVLVPYYGSELDRLTTHHRPKGARHILRSEAPTGKRLDPISAASVVHIAERAGVDREQALAEAGMPVVHPSPRCWEWVHVLASATQRRAPWLANVGITRFAADVRAYLTRQRVRRAVHTLVEPSLRRGPSVVVAHSLGTVVAYWLLTELQGVTPIELFVTVGSPLGVDIIKAALPQPLTFPPGVRSWLNVTDPRDFVALTERLDEQTFLPGIENIDDVRNPLDPHDIRGYLADERVARRIAQALA